MASITALTIQSTQGVRKVIGLDPGTVTETLECLAEDVRFDAIKVGMLGDGAVAAAVMALAGRAEKRACCAGSGDEVQLWQGLTGSGRVRDLAAGRVGSGKLDHSEFGGIGRSGGKRDSGKWRRNGESCARSFIEWPPAREIQSLKIVVTGGHAKTPDDLLLVDGKFCWFPWGKG